MSKGIQKIFAEAARTYEMINHLLTFGLDVLLRKKTARLASVSGGKRWLDICSGTGEMAAALRKTSLPDTVIVSLDLSLDMLRRAKKKKEFRSIDAIQADSGEFPFHDDYFDIVTISFATRNLSPTRERLINYLKEIRRVLRPGGMFINLETSQPKITFIRLFYHLYVRYGARYLGELISGSRSGYAYLAYTVPRFYNSREFAKVMQLAGFKNVRIHEFLLSTFAIHQGVA